MSYNNSVKINSISLSHSNITLEVGKKFYGLSASIYPSNATNKTLTWRSDNPAVASVSNGVITAKSNGSAKITAEATDGSEVFASCNVKVIGTAYIKSIEVIPSTLRITAGDTKYLYNIVCPYYADNQGIFWSSSNTSIAVVNSSSGLVTAKSAGTAIIYANSQDGSGVKGACHVTVDKYIPVTSVSLYGEKVYTIVGNGFKPGVTVSPANASNKTVVWKSSNESVAAVDYYSGYVYTLRCGETTITATSVDGDITASCTLIVVQALTGADKYITDQNTIDTIINSKKVFDAAYSMFLSGEISESQLNDIKKTTEYTADLARADYVVVNDQSDFAYQYFKKRNYKNGDVSPFTRNLVYNESNPMSGLDVMIVQRGMQAIGFFEPDEDYVFGTYDIETFNAAKGNNVFGNDTFLENSYRVIFNYTNKSQRTPQWLLELQEYTHQHKITQTALAVATQSETEVIIKKGGPSKKYSGKADLLGDRGIYSEIWEIKHYHTRNLQIGQKQLERYIEAATENDQNFSKPLIRGYDFETFYIKYTDNTCLEISSTTVSGLVFYKEIQIPDPAPAFFPVVFPAKKKEYEYTIKKLPLREGLVAITVILIAGALYVEIGEAAIPLAKFLVSFA